jgi:hypothetical protein
MFLTRGGNACAVILIAAQASWLERHAPEELQKYVRHISGAALPISTWVPRYREETLALRRERLAYIRRLRQSLETLCRG